MMQLPDRETFILPNLILSAVFMGRPRRKGGGVYSRKERTKTTMKSNKTSMADN